MHGQAFWQPAVAICHVQIYLEVIREGNIFFDRRDPELRKFPDKKITFQIYFLNRNICPENKISSRNLDIVIIIPNIEDPVSVNVSREENFKYEEYLSRRISQFENNPMKKE